MFWDGGGRYGIRKSGGLLGAIQFNSSTLFGLSRTHRGAEWLRRGGGEAAERKGWRRVQWWYASGRAAAAYASSASSSSLSLETRPCLFREDFEEWERVRKIDRSRSNMVVRVADRLAWGAMQIETSGRQVCTSHRIADAIQRVRSMRAHVQQSDTSLTHLTPHIPRPFRQTGPSPCCRPFSATHSPPWPRPRRRSR